MSTYVAGISSLDLLAQRLHATPTQVERALKRAVAVTTRWAAAEGRGRIADRLFIRLSALKGRVNVYIRKDAGAEGKGWFGLNDIPSNRLNPRQTKTGARMDGMTKEIPHAFVREKNGKRFMFRRVGKARYPLELIGLPIESVGNEVIANEVMPRIEDRFHRAFQHELHWEIHKS